MEQLICTACNRTFDVDPGIWRCPCGSPLDLRFEAHFPLHKISERGPTLWRYREAIPISQDENILSMGEGFTPLEEMELGGHRVFVKMDFLFPTGSYKDRGATVLISKVKEMGVRRVVEDSSGNAGCAVAAYCARGGIECEIYVPESTSKEKLAQIEAYGAVLNRIPGSRERTAEITLEAASRTYYASHCWNPFFFHGTKTFAYEVWEQMNRKEPDTLVLPVGHGTLFLGVYLGFSELREAGLIRRIPKLVGVQSASCDPLYQAFKGGKDEIPSIEKGETVAEGIAIAVPVRGRQILKAVYETEGEVLAVREEEIYGAVKEMGRKGYFIEPTSAATIAGLKRYLDRKERQETVVSTFTGTGLKSSGKML
jgi:threonine synthase